MATVRPISPGVEALLQEWEEETKKIISGEITITKSEEDFIRDLRSEISKEMQECLQRYAYPTGCCPTLNWIIFRIVNAVKRAFSCFGCCQSDWQKIRQKIAASKADENGKISDLTYSRTDFILLYLLDLENRNQSL